MVESNGETAPTAKGERREVVIDISAMKGTQSGKVNQLQRTSAFCSEQISSLERSAKSKQLVIFFLVKSAAKVGLLIVCLTTSTLHFEYCKVQMN